MEDLQKNRLNPSTLRPTVLDINLDALASNFSAVQKFVGASQVMPIVKANAYGHGLVTCSRFFERLGAPMLGAAFLEEGIELRQAGVKIPILVLGGIVGSQIQYFLDFDLDMTASSVSKLEIIEEAAAACKKRARVHLKIDTGLERIGVHYYSAGSLLEKSLECAHCDIVGIFSHFACARDNLEYTKLQLERFLETVSFYEKRSVPTPLRHIAASAALLNLKESHLDMVRPGITLYGAYPTRAFSDKIDLTPAMSLRSQVVFFKVVKKGAGVSYGHAFVAPEDIRVVTIPVGYGDGYPRRLSNKGSVLIRGRRYPIAGVICMDQVMVNLGKDGEAYNGDEVVLIGSQDNERITVNDLAEIVDTNAHEIMVALNLRVPRHFHLNGKVISEWNEGPKYL